ncbi:MAG: hypothetical protein EOM15_07965 [Spirochaetia bacterium]|jgi:hypothetical protein|nr:hypothetical protein [Sphaerochaeta sp.]NCC64576.1 hypothetical protein [Spirochaetia bacterium]
MRTQDKELVIEIYKDENTQASIAKIRELSLIAGVLVGLREENGKLLLCYRYSDEFSEFCRNRNAGRPRKYRARTITVKEVRDMIKTSGAKETARFVGIPLSTFYYRLKVAEKLRAEDKFE